MKDYDLCFKRGDEYFGEKNNTEEKITKEEFHQWIRGKIKINSKQKKMKYLFNLVEA